MKPSKYFFFPIGIRQTSSFIKERKNNNKNKLNFFLFFFIFFLQKTTWKSSGADFEKSRQWETPKFSTDANRRTNKERNIQGFFSSSGNLDRRGAEGSAVHVLYIRVLVYIFIHLTTLHFFPMQSFKRNIVLMHSNSIPWTALNFNV